MRRVAVRVGGKPLEMAAGGSPGPPFLVSRAAVNVGCVVGQEGAGRGGHGGGGGGCRHERRTYIEAMDAGRRTVDMPFTLMSRCSCLSKTRVPLFLKGYAMKGPRWGI
jgi:hypothetical protein